MLFMEKMCKTLSFSETLRIKNSFLQNIVINKITFGEWTATCSVNTLPVGHLPFSYDISQGWYILREGNFPLHYSALFVGFVILFIIKSRRNEC